MVEVLKLNWRNLGWALKKSAQSRPARAVGLYFEGEISQKYIIICIEMPNKQSKIWEKSGASLTDVLVKPTLFWSGPGSSGYIRVHPSPFGSVQKKIDEKTGKMEND